MISHAEALEVRAAIRKALRTGEKTAGDIAARTGIDRKIISGQLRRLKETKAVTNNGSKDQPVWRLTEEIAVAQDDFRPTAPKDIQELMATQWRGTPWQGLESVL